MDRFVDVQWIAQIDEDLHSYNAQRLVDGDIIKPNPSILGVSHRERNMSLEFKLIQQNFVRWLMSLIKHGK
jgi:hypothetical protein